MAELLICNEVVAGSSPVAGSIAKALVSTTVCECNFATTARWAARWIGDSEATASTYYRDLLPEKAPAVSMPVGGLS